MKVLIISGFLGAGKTTFIKELVNRTGRDIAIFENEYAAEGMDKTILENGITNGEVDIFELQQGCICCSTKGDFRESVLTIANTVDPEILVVEPTGVGMLSNVAANIRDIEYERIRLLAPVTIVDGNSIDRYSKEYCDLFEDQVSGSHTVVVSKLEGADEETRSDVKEKLQAINPDAHILTEHYTGMDEEWFNSLFDEEHKGTVKERPESEAPLPEEFSLEGIRANSHAYLICFLEDLVRGEFGGIIRAKGHIKINDETLRFEVADRTYYITGAGGEAADSAVFIGHGIKRQALRKKLFASTGSASMLFIKKMSAGLFKTGR